MRSCLLGGEDLQAPALEQVRAQMQEQQLAQFAAEGFGADQVELRCSADVRFRGQTSEIGIDLADGPITPEGVARLRADFVREHERLYGHRSDPDNPVEVVAVRLVGQAGVRGLGHGLETAVQPVAGGGQSDGLFRRRDLGRPPSQPPGSRPRN